MDEIEHRKYLLSYHKQSFYGFWKSLLDSPPCKPPSSPRNKDFSYELEAIVSEKHELFLHLIGGTYDLNAVEKQLAKYKIARIEAHHQIVLITDRMPDFSAVHMFQQFCLDKGYRIRGKEIYQDDRIIKTYK